MIYFGNRRPRGFHYTRRFGSEQRDVLDSLRRGMSPEEVAARSLGEQPSDDGRRRRGGHALLVMWALMLAALAIAFAVLGVSLL